MKNKLINTKGFTILEIILVLAILGIVLSFSLLYAQTSQIRADINTQAAIISSYLRVAQTNAMAGNDTKANAVHLEPDSYTLFRGINYSPSDSFNYTIELSPTLSIENILLNGGGDNVIFSGPDGETENSGSFQLTSEQIAKTITINISELGTVNY